jgi:uncharacterized protein
VALMERGSLQHLVDLAPDLVHILEQGNAAADLTPVFAEADIRCTTLLVSMRDGIRLATDLYLPPVLPASAVAMRTPYGRATPKYVRACLTLARHGYVAISQDCRGTGDSEPDVWQYSIYESEDGSDFVEWVTQQDWFSGFFGSFGGSYGAATQWGMSTHPGMSAIVPEVSGLQVTRNTVRRYMFVNGYSRAVGKGANRVSVSREAIERLIEAETMAGGYFNEPLRTPLPTAALNDHLENLPLSEAKRELWAFYCGLPASSRLEFLKRLLGVSEFSYADYGSLPVIFDCLIPYGLHTIPSVRPADLCKSFHAPALFVMGWYDWNLGDALPSWVTFRREAESVVASRSRLLITPSAHNAPGYREGESDSPGLRHNHRNNVGVLLRWYEAVRQGTTDSWPTVIYYLMGANRWCIANDWPVPEARSTALYLGSDQTLSFDAPQSPSEPDHYTYDPRNPTPTVGGSVLSYLYPAGSIDVSEVQQREDVLTYTTQMLERDLDVVGPLRLILYASSSAVDTDFSGRLSDVFPDGRAIQLQSGILRARYRNLAGDPELLEPGKIYRLEIDLWATANRFKAGHRLRLDISSADFPRFDRNTNCGGESRDPISARQTIYHDPEHPSHLLLPVL